MRAAATARRAGRMARMDIVLGGCSCVGGKLKVEESSVATEPGWCGVKLSGVARFFDESLH